MRKVKKKNGFSILELLTFIVLAVLVGLILLPTINTARDRATLISTSKDMSMWSRAIQDYIIDYSHCPPNPNGNINYTHPFLKEIYPYLSDLRVRDWWGYTYYIWTGSRINKYGIPTSTSRDFVIVSTGRFGIMDDWKYDRNNPDTGFFSIKSREDFEKDLILWNHKFVRYPRHLK